MGGCMGQWVGSGQMTNLIKLELINIIWFCLKIYNLSRHPYLWVDGWVNGWAHVKPLKSNKSWPNRDNSIMDILLDILLKPPQPFIRLFLNLHSRFSVEPKYCFYQHGQLSGYRMQCMWAFLYHSDLMIIFKKEVKLLHNGLFTRIRLSGLSSLQFTS